MKRTALLILSCLLAIGPGCKDHDNDRSSQGAHAGHDDHKDDDHKDDDHKDDDHKDDDHKDGDDGHDDHAKGAASGEERVVRLAPETLSQSGVRLGTAAAGTLAGAFEVPAEVQLNPDRVAHISPLVEGQLLNVAVALGDRVDAKAQLAQLRSVALGQARADLSRAASLRDVAEQNRDRQRRLRAEGISSARSLLEAELAFKQASAERDAARSRLRVFGLRGGSGPDMTLESPIAGVVVERHATRGENVSPDDTLFIIADLSRVWVIGQVYEQQVAQVAPDMRATLTLNAYPGRRWEGTVDFVGATLDAKTRTLPVRVEIDNTDGLLRPGLFGALRLASGAPTGASVVVPLASVQTVGGQTVVFVPDHEDGAFEARPVTVGRESAQQVEVLEGLKPGAQLVVEGAFILKSELMRGELGHGHAH